MDAKERLKRYLEQRRELGEREFVLDGMSVEEVMRVVGAMVPHAAGGAAGARTSGPTPAPPPEASSPEPNASVAGPDATAPARGGAAPHGDDDIPNDWRDVLRAAGGAPPADRAVPSTARGTAEEGSASMPRKREQSEADATGETRADRERGRTAPRPEGGKDAGMEPSPAPGAATPAAAEGVEPPLPRAGRGAARGSTVDAPDGLVVGAASRELFGGPFANLKSLEEIAATVARCTRCPLYQSATNPVPGEGNAEAEFMCVGEAPGANEDATGRPFVGQAGQLLTKILAAIKLTREEVFIANVLKHRPPGNRNPLPNEVEACSPYLVRQLELIRPKVIVAFGTFAAQTLLNTKLPISKLRGSVHRYYGTPLVVTYHPAALLRNPAWKRPTWEDVQLARRILDSARSGA